MRLKARRSRSSLWLLFLCRISVSLQLSAFSSDLPTLNCINLSALLFSYICSQLPGISIIPHSLHYTSISDLIMVSESEPVSPNSIKHLS